MTETRLATERVRPFATSLLVIVVSWAIGLAVSLAMVSAGWVSGSGGVLQLAAVGSGLVAVASVLPGLLGEVRETRGASPRRGSSGVMIGFSVGVLIRVAGTVALVGLCSYHLPAAREEIAGTILAWYVYLTTVDVAVLATLLPRLDRKTTAPRS